MAAADWVKVDYETLPDSVYGILRHNGRDYIVPALPYIDIDPQATIVFKGWLCGGILTKSKSNGRHVQRSRDLELVRRGS